MRELLETTSQTAPYPACGVREIVHGLSPTCLICGSQSPKNYEPRLGDSYLKYSFSWLLDLPMRVAYDDKKRQ